MAHYEYQFLRTPNNQRLKINRNFACRLLCYFLLPNLRCNSEKGDVFSQSYNLTINHTVFEFYYIRDDLWILICNNLLTLDQIMGDSFRFTTWACSPFPFKEKSSKTPSWFGSIYNGEAKKNG